MQNNDKFKKGPEVPQFFSNKPLPLPKREKVIETLTAVFQTSEKRFRL